VTWESSNTNSGRRWNIVHIVPGTDDVFVPPYAYELDPVSSVPGLVQQETLRLCRRTPEV